MAALVSYAGSRGRETLRLHLSDRSTLPKQHERLRADDVFFALAERV
jgi:hypothetical protein